MILIVLAVLCAATVPATGGRLRQLADVDLRALWLAPVALGIQVIITEVAPDGSQNLHSVAHLVSYALIVGFLWANLSIEGVTLIAAGTAANVVAIAVNRGVMPAARTAQRLAGLVEDGGFHNSGIVAHPHLLWLGDIIPVPGPLPNVLSAGDCLIFLGMLVFLHSACRVRRDPIELAPVDEDDAADAEAFTFLGRGRDVVAS